MNTLTQEQVEKIGTHAGGIYHEVYEYKSDKYEWAFTKEEFAAACAAAFAKGIALGVAQGIQQEKDRINSTIPQYQH
jgi:hypothetical protein